MKPSSCLLTLILLLSACSGDSAKTTGDAAAPPATASEPAPARMENGVQVAEIAVEPEGYRPSGVSLQAGVPARLVFTRTADGTCAKSVQAPDFGVPKTALPLGTPIAITFTPSEAGTFTFGCGMDMVKGTVVVRQG